LLVIGEVLSLLVAVARSWFVPRSRLQAEILLLRHQLNVLRRSANSRPHLTAGDRLLFVWLYRLWPGVLRSLTLLREYWKAARPTDWLFPGRIPGVPLNVKNLQRVCVETRQAAGLPSP